MANNIIKIKRSSTANAPSSLKSGELAYSYGTTPGSNPDRLFFGAGDDGSGNATSIRIIGGAYYAGLIDASSAGTLTTNAKSIPVLSATGTINDWLVGNLELTGNTLSTTNGNLNVILSANGTGKVQVNTSTNSFTLPGTRTTQTGYVLTANTDGTTSWSASVSTLNLATDNSGTGSVNLLNQTLTIAGGNGIVTSISGQTVTISSIGAGGYTSTPTAAGITTLTSSSTANQFFTGTQTQTVKLPSTATLTLGQEFIITNNSTGVVTVQTSAAGAITTIPGGSQATFTVASTASQTWIAEFTGNNTVTGTGAVVLANSPTLVTPTLGAATATSINGLTISSTTGTLTVANGKTLTASNTLTFTGTDSSSVAFGTGGTVTYTSNKLSVFSATTSAELAGVISDETGTGLLVFNTSPTLVTPTLGAALATSINGLTISSTTGTITIANGKTLTASNTLTFTGTDSSSVAFGTGGTVTYTSNKLSVFAATTSAELAGVISDETGTGLLVFNTSPTFSTSILTPVVTTSGATSLTLNTNSNSGPGASITVQSGTNSNVNLAPSGTGTVDVGNTRITNVATPTQSTDAATKAYVDATTTGLDVKASVRMATTSALTVTASGTGLNKTLTNAGAQAPFTVDNVPSVQQGDRVLVKNQTGANAKDNGIYTVTTVGTVSTNWVLTRATDADNTPTGEVTAGMFTFVEEGDTLGDTGWVLTTNNPITLDSTNLTFTQFSGAGTYLASNGVQLVGNTFSVNLGTNSSLTTTGGTLQVNSTIAGNGLTYTSGIIDVVGTTNRISVTADAIDISSSYVGQNTITTLGTVTTGTWNAVAVAAQYGGTGVGSYSKGDLLYAGSTSSTLSALSVLAAGTDGMVLQQQNGVPSWGYLDGGTY